MITPADIRFWTDITVSADDCARLAVAAEARLNADGGYSIVGEQRKQLLCYLAAAMLESRTTPSRKQAESIGSYSYTAKSTAFTNGWYDVYHELLVSLIEDAGSPSSTNGGIVVRMIDAELVRLNREFHP